MNQTTELIVNLIPQARRAKQAAHRRARAWFRFMRIYVIILAAACGLALLPAHAAEPALDSSLARLDKRISTSSATMDKMKAEIASLTAKINAAKAVGDHPDWSLLLGALAAQRNGEVVLESFDLTFVKPEKPKDAAAADPAHGKSGKTREPAETVVIKVGALASTPTSPFAYAGRVEALGLFDSVTVKNTKAQSVGQMPATHFDLELIVTASGAPDKAANPTGGTK